MRNTAPIAIFAFNRPESLRLMLDSLKKNPLFNESDIYIFIDGPRNEQDKILIAKVTTLAHTITDNVFVSDVNKGLSASIISGITKVINKYGKVIVLEDDLRLMPGFLKYMNEGLDQNENDSKIFSICGYGLKIDKPINYIGDVYLGIRSSSWGWATWQDRWDSIDWDVADWDNLSSNRSLQHEFNKGGSDMYGMLRGYMTRQNNSWAIRYCYSQFKQGRYSIHPFLSFVDNDGYGENATNCRQKYSRFKVNLNHENNPTIKMPINLIVNYDILKANYFYHSLPIRIYSKIRQLLNI
jgi:hypothetical protein